MKKKRWSPVPVRRLRIEYARAKLLGNPINIGLYSAAIGNLRRHRVWRGEQHRKEYVDAIIRIGEHHDPSTL